MQLLELLSNKNTNITPVTHKSLEEVISITGSGFSFTYCLEDILLQYKKILIK